MRPFSLWNNRWLRAFLIALTASLLSSSLAWPQDAVDSTPKLLLTTQRLRRLERDRSRQTVRWVNFENRVNTAADSPERGFELALYYAITHDEKRGQEAITWALAHKCEQRQVALVLDWSGSLISAEQKRALALPCAGEQSRSAKFADTLHRDTLFSEIAQNGSENPMQPASWKLLLADLKNGSWRDPDVLYAACEYLAAIRSTQHLDLRQDDTGFFSSLPVELLLSLKPAQVQHPDWMTHVAALALVALDPNLESSQFLQGWVLEDSQMLREGPGIGYELLWADPYLPGVGYENLDPWTYDAKGRLYARSSWNTDSCWIAISSSGVEQQNCPSGWQNVPTQFGHMSLIPMSGHCVDVPHHERNNESVVLWKLQPHGKVFYLQGEKKESLEADSAGLWRLPENVEGHVCTSLDKLKRP